MSLKNHNPDSLEEIAIVTPSKWVTQPLEQGVKAVQESQLELTVPAVLFKKDPEHCQLLAWIECGIGIDFLDFCTALGFVSA